MSATKFQKLITNPFLFRLYLLKKLPLAFIAGLRVKELSEERAVTTVKYGWLTQNPFRSMYFACLSMAAEMSTGLLVLNGVYNSKPAISMLIIKNQAIYHKKAIGNITFTCSDGNLINTLINKAKVSGESVLVDTTSIGKDEAGDVVAEFTFTWSMKAKN
ncbi:MAG: DUF4442 domain-containing protein [Bacteroidetes bacterium]|nr:DUF4442 domain-containing protein [Bacteroidota bacterium]